MLYLLMLLLGVGVGVYMEDKLNLVNVIKDNINKLLVLLHLK